MDKVATDFEFYQQTQCLPLYTLLTALNVSRVDFLSLDTEGGELETLRNFPFDKIEIDFLTIEYRPANWDGLDISSIDRYNVSLTEMIEKNYSKAIIKEREAIIKNLENQELIEFMQGKGYYLLDIFCVAVTDFFFIRIDSELFQKLKVPGEALKRKSVCGDKILNFSYKKLPSFALYEIRDRHHYPQLAYRKTIPKYVFVAV